MTYPDDVPVLSDGQVTLRAHRHDDLDAIVEQCNDPETREWTSVPATYTHDGALSYLADRQRGWESGRSWSFAVEIERGACPGRFGGSLGVSTIGDGIGAINFGAHPAVRGRGVMTAAVRLIVEWAFDCQGIRTLVWETIEGNVASLRVAWKTGFTFEGSTRQTKSQRGQLRHGWRATLLSTDSRVPATRWLDPVVLEDDKVRLREVRIDDEQRFLETSNDDESMVWLATIPFARDAAAFRRHLASRAVGCATGASVEWTIADVSDDRYLGTLNLFGLTGLDYNSAEVGYRTHPDARGRGFLKAGLVLALRHAFAPRDDGGLGLGRVSLGAGDGNLASLGVARSLGFTETGRDRQNYDLADGRVVDLIRFDLLAPEFGKQSANRPT